MEIKPTFLMITIAIIVVSNFNETKAQNTSPFWSLQGNSNATTSKKLGTTNAVPLRLVTNNSERIRITPNGNVGIGTNTPATRLEVLGGNWDLSSTEGDFRIGNSTFRMKIGVALAGAGAGDVRIRAAGGTNRLMLGVDEALTIDGNGRVGIGTFEPAKHLHIKGTGDQEIGIQSTDANAHLWTLQSNGTSSAATTFQIIDRTLGVSRLGITNDGNVGIGTTTPGFPLNFADALGDKISLFGQGGSGGVQSYGFGIQNFLLQIHTDADFSDIAFGYGSSASFTETMRIKGDGRVGIGTSTPAAGYKLTLIGSGLASGGIWQNSDQKIKQNISELSSAIDIINQLKPKTYFFKTGEYAKLDLPIKKQYGFIAQEMEKVLPELVNTSKQTVRMDAKGQPQLEDIKAVNYTLLIPLLTKAIQEQQQEINELKQMVEKLSPKAINTSTSAALSKSTNVILSNATLEQNKPNPLTQSTIIRYNIPLGAKNAQIVVTDFTGKLIKQVTIASEGLGEINIDASALSGGTYTYSLLINGKVITSKKMVVTK